MKTKWIVIFVFAAAVIVIIAARGKQLLTIFKYSQKAAVDPAQAAISYWTCSMHPQVHKDGPGLCPICHMQLVPVYKEDQSHQHDTGAGVVKVTEARQKQGGIKLSVVKKEPFQVTLRTTGKAALDTELASAVKEFITLGKEDPALARSAAARLRILGMGPEEIRQLELNPASVESLYQVATPGIAWVYATLYEQEVDLIKVGQTAIISPSYAPEKELTGTVRSVSSVVDQASRSVRARILVRDPQGILRPEAYLRVTVQANLGPRIVIPRSAVVYTGKRQIVFVAADADTFQAREIKVGQESGERIVVAAGLNEGDRIVTSGAFLIDSESRLQSAIDEAGE